jgi:hypothetical protein
MSTNVLPAESENRRHAPRSTSEPKGPATSPASGDRIGAAEAIRILGWPKKKFYRALKTYAGDPIVVPVANKAFRKIQTVPLFGGEKHEGAAWEFSAERCRAYAERIKADT